jgi:hypothetical protein
MTNYGVRNVSCDQVFLAHDNTDTRFVCTDSDTDPAVLLPAFLSAGTYNDFGAFVTVKSFL